MIAMIEPMLISTKNLLISNKTYYSRLEFTFVKLDPKIVIENNPEVYEPAEDSYFLLGCVEVKKGEKVLELGTGCGLIALHCAKTADVTAADVNPHAVELTKRNAHHNGLKLEVLESDLFKNISGKYDVIVFNPPYLYGHEEKDWLDKAWSGGVDGEQVILRFLSEVKDFLRPEGRIYLLLSSGNNKALEILSKKFNVKELGEKKLFFEVLKAFELSL